MRCESVHSYYLATVFSNNIMKQLIYVFFVLVLYEMYLAGAYRQERAVVKVCNPKYTSVCTAMTKRSRRDQPYRTNFTIVLLQPIYNNVTVRVIYGTKGYPKLFDIKVKGCDVRRTKWLKDYFETFSNVPVTCPVPAGSYGIYNMEIPPKNFPFPIPNEDIYLSSILEITDTKEVIIEISLTLYKE